MKFCAALRAHVHAHEAAPVEADFISRRAAVLGWGLVHVDDRGRGEMGCRREA